MNLSSGHGHHRRPSGLAPTTLLAHYIRSDGYRGLRIDLLEGALSESLSRYNYSPQRGESETSTDGSKYLSTTVGFETEVSQSHANSEQLPHDQVHKSYCETLKTGGQHDESSDIPKTDTPDLEMDRAERLAAMYRTAALRTGALLICYLCGNMQRACTYQDHVENCYKALMSSHERLATDLRCRLLSIPTPVMDVDPSENPWWFNVMALKQATAGLAMCKACGVQLFAPDLVQHLDSHAEEQNTALSINNPSV